MSTAALLFMLPNLAIADNHDTAETLGGELAAMAAALDVTETLARSCMPAPLQVQVAQHPDLDEITACFQVEKPELTASEVNTAWTQFGPRS
jgi:hypothetical protein